MTKLNAKILSAIALLAFASPATAENGATPNLVAMLGTVGIGNPHPVRQATATGGNREEQRRRVEIAEWEKLFGRQAFPGMGVGTHSR